MMIPTSAAQYIRKEFIGSFVNEASPANWDPKNDKGVFGITLLSLTNWDALAGLANGTGRSTSVETAEFMAAHLGRVHAPFGDRYQRRSGIIYAIYRHGLAHQRFPSTVRASCGDVTWVLDRRDLPDDQHLALLGPLAPGEAKTLCGVQFVSGLPGSPIPPRSFLVLKSDLLYQHSLRAFEEFADQCDRDPLLERAVQRGVAAAKTPKPLDSRRLLALVDDGLSAHDPWP